MKRLLFAILMLFAPASFADPMDVEFSRSAEPQWFARHCQTIDKTQHNYDVLLLGDSITQGWELHQNEWNQSLPTLKTVNAGIASDRIEHILWRVNRGLLDHGKPKVVVLMAGINNLALATPYEIVQGLSRITKSIRARSPNTQILLIGLLPSGELPNNPHRASIAKVNTLISTLATDHIHYLDIGRHFLTKRGILSKAISFDGVHLTKLGYSIWAKQLRKPVLTLLHRQ